MAYDIEELITSASSGNDASITKLTELVKTKESAELKEQAANFDFLFDEWAKDEETDAKRAGLLLTLAERDALDSTSFRDQLNEVVGFILPPYIASQAVQRAIGARDTSVQPHEVVLRLKKLQKLRNGALICIPAARSWNRISGIERFSATVSVTSLRSGSNNSMPISNLFSGAYFFESHRDVCDLLSPTASTLKTAAIYRQAFGAHAIPELSEAKLMDVISSIVVPDCLTPDQFELWWHAAELQPAAKPAKRQIWDARSVLELYTLISPEPEKAADKKAEKAAAKMPEGVELTEEQAAKLTALFTRIHKEMDGKTVTMLAEAIAILSILNSPEMLKAMFTPLKGKVPFWPATSKELAISEKLEIWGHVPMKLLHSFIRATSCLYTPEEMAAFGCVLPLRSLTVFFDSLPIEKIASAIFNAKELSSDILLYLWKNRTKCPVNLTQIVDMEHIAKALTRGRLPKEWAAAQREIKKVLFEKEEFQKFVIDNADGDIPSVIDALQKVRTFQFGECQSLLVKLSKHSEELRERLEKGEGSTLIKRRPRIVVEAPTVEVPFSSVHSISQLVKDLDNIINVQIPENVAAIKHARSYGDLSENAEYDAAKQEKRNLNSRRAKLEAILGSVQAANFSMIEVKDTVVMGSSATVKTPAGKTVTYYIVGAFDGDADAMKISYQAPIGKTLLEHKAGDTVTFPDGGKYTITKVAPLPAEMIELFGKEV